ncbi:MAG: zf-HC2 domain-containing protein [Bryobacteraceae bacterium]
MAHDPERCKQIFALLSEYLDLELPPEACAEIESHMTDCAPCIEFAKSLKTTIALCRQHSPEVMPKPLSAEAQATLRSAWTQVLASGNNKSA